MNFKKLLLLAVLIAIAYSLKEFKNKKERDLCLVTCSSPVTSCLTDPACQSAYTTCLSESNFVTCLQSANGIMMQAIVQCV